MGYASFVPCVHLCVRWYVVSPLGCEMNLMLLPLAAGLGACRHGFVLAPDGACIRCPAHFDCTNASNVESTRVQSGWWRPSNTSLTAHKCIPPERCTGGGAGDAGCSPGSSLYGILCEVCPAGSRYANGSCQRCNAGASSLSAAILVVIFLVLLVLPFFVVKLQGRRPKGSPRAVDPAGAATAATPSPSLPIPPPNGDLGGGEARPREGIARRARAQSLVERLTSYARRLNHYLRGHVWRRLRTIWRGAALGNKLRMTVGHLQLVSLLPSTYLLNPLHGVEQVSHVFSTRGSVTEWEEGSCLFTSIRQPVLLLVLKTWTPLLICAVRDRASDSTPSLHHAHSLPHSVPRDSAPPDAFLGLRPLAPRPSFAPQDPICTTVPTCTTAHLHHGHNYGGSLRVPVQLWLLLGLLHGCRYNTDPAGRPRPLNFAKIKRGFIRAEERRLRNAPARGHRLRDGHLLASVVTRVRQDESARDAIRDAAGGRSDGPAAAGHPVATDSSAVESAEVPPAHRQLTKQLTVALGTWWEETVRKRGLPLYFLPYNASSTAMLSPILGLLHLLAPFLAQDAFDLLFAVEQRADGVSYVEGACHRREGANKHPQGSARRRPPTASLVCDAPSPALPGDSHHPAPISPLRSSPPPHPLALPRLPAASRTGRCGDAAAPSVEWDSAEHAKLRRHATAEAVIYGGLVPLFYLAVLSANDKHIRDGSNTNNARAVQLLTSGYRRERAAEKVGWRVARLNSMSPPRSPEEPRWVWARVRLY